MRIISGSHKGRRFRPPKGFKSRPTTDLARESLFNILSNTYHFDGLITIDLFAGSGSVSFEFASRGAEKVMSIEKSYPVFKHLIKLVNEFNLQQIRVVKKDVFAWLKKTDENADVIFADPPFDLENIKELPKIILEKKMINEGGCLILEHAANITFDEFEEYSYTKNYGAVHFSFFFVD